MGQQILHSPVAAAIASQQTHRLYGVTLGSDFAFANRLMPGTAQPQLTFHCTEAGAPAVDWQATAPVYASPVLDDDGNSELQLFQTPDYSVLHYPNCTDYYLWRDRIICHLTNDFHRYWVEVGLLGGVLSFWLEQQGVIALHAAAVVVNGNAIAFAATNKGGKTSLAASLMQLGYPLLTDDILPVAADGPQVLGRPGYPQMRMWPDQAEHFWGAYQGLEQVVPHLSKRRIPVDEGGFGQFWAEPVPLRCLYLPDRRPVEYGGTAVEITRLSPREALLELVKHAFAAQLVEAVPQMQLHRFRRLAQIAAQVSVRRLSYPSGVAYLPQVREAILQDAQA